MGEEGVRQSLASGQKSALAVLGAYGTPVLRLPGESDVLAIPLNGAPSTLIVKPDNPNLSGITENEVWCLRRAQAIGMEAAQATILQSSKRTAIGVLRYDRRVGRSGQLLRLHQEDFAQANGLPTGREYQRGTLPGLDLKTLLETGRHVSASDALALLDQVIFSILVANTDTHAKNYSLIWIATVAWTWVRFLRRWRMFRLHADLRVYLHREPIDFRAGIARLAVLIQEEMRLIPFAPAVYGFCNRCRERIKLLFFPRSGFALVLKRLGARIGSAGRAGAMRL